MINMRIAALAVGLAGVVAVAPVWLTAPVLAAEAATESEDIISLDDGRTLRGKIISETDDEIVFELIDRDKAGKVRSRAKLTLDKSKVVGIERGIALKTTAPAPATGPAQPAAKPAADDDAASADEAKPDQGAQTTGESTDASLPLIYVVPMKRQMGTDVSPDIYKEVVEDIKTQKPALIVFQMNCKDDNELMTEQGVNRDKMGLAMFDEYRELVNLLKDDLRDVPQVMWVNDATGVAAMFAMAWSDLYMTSSARLGGMDFIIKLTGASSWSDKDVRAKMEAAMYGYINGFLEYGKYPVQLGQSMIVPKFMLSASFVGRDVKWMLDDSGHYVVDDDDEAVVSFNARKAENLGVSDGTIDQLDDLVFLLGFREYRTDQGRGQKLVDDYIKSWRRAFDDCKSAYQDYGQFRQWASGPDTIPYLGKAKKCLQQIVAAMRRYKAVEIRFQMGTNLNITALEVEIEQIEEQIRALNRSGGGGRRGGGGGGGSGIGR